MFSLDDLARTIASRAQAGAEKSYTRSLLDKGPRGAAKKFGEEAVETALAAVSGSKQQLAAESGDALYHLLVLWASAGITPDDVYAELKKRESQSGLSEKASRTS